MLIFCVLSHAWTYTHPHSALSHRYRYTRVFRDKSSIYSMGFWSRAVGIPIHTEHVRTSCGQIKPVFHPSPYEAIFLASWDLEASLCVGSIVLSPAYGYLCRIFIYNLRANILHLKVHTSAQIYVRQLSATISITYKLVLIDGINANKGWWHQRESSIPFIYLSITHSSCRIV